MLQALIFDVDGTLSETEETHRAAFNQAFAEASLGWSWDQALYRKLLDVTGGKERIRYYMSDFDAQRTPAIPVDTAALTDWIAALHARKTAHYNEMVDAGSAGLRPGVGPLIRHARDAGMRLAIATTTSLPNVESLIRATLGADGMDLFEAVAAGDMVKAKKPAPDVYLLALEQLGLPPAACLALEDFDQRPAIGACSKPSGCHHHEHLHQPPGVPRRSGDPAGPRRTGQGVRRNAGCGGRHFRNPARPARQESGRLT